MSTCSALAQIGVATAPGATTITSMPNGSSSRRKPSDNPSSANFEAAYGERNGTAFLPPTELILTMRPGVPLSVRSVPRSGPNALVVITTPVRLMSICRRKSSSGSSKSDPAKTTPALLTSPNSFSPASTSPTRAAADPTASSSVTSKTIGTKALPNSAESRSASAFLRTLPNTRKPRAIRTLVVPQPIPVDVPVTTTLRMRCSVFVNLSDRRFERRRQAQCALEQFVSRAQRKAREHEQRARPLPDHDPGLRPLFEQRVEHRLDDDVGIVRADF